MMVGAFHVTRGIDRGEQAQAADADHGAREDPDAGCHQQQQGQGPYDGPLTLFLI